MEYYQTLSPDEAIKLQNKIKREYRPKQTKVWKLVYIINKKEIEELSTNTSYSLLVYLRKQAKATGNYNSGKLKIKPKLNS